MRPILLLPFVLLGACNTPDFFSITHPDGSREQLMPTPAMMGGKRTVMYRHTSGAAQTEIAIMQNNEKSFDSAVTGAVAAGLGHFAMKEAIAADEAAAGVKNATTAAGVSKAQIAADVEKAKIAADVTKTITLPK